MSYNNFSKLNPKAKIFEELEQNPAWWELLKADKDLYIDIRKDKYINVYYQGSSIAKISYTSDFKASIHKKYLDGRFFNKSPYTELNLKSLNEATLKAIKSRIDAMKANAEDKEDSPTEKQLQVQIVMSEGKYIDTEFQYNKDANIGPLRIDLVELENKTLSFIELKRITDNRLLNAPDNKEVAEIITQMAKYKAFLETYSAELTIHYQHLISIKQKLGLLSLDSDDFSINTNPKLLIINTYKRNTKGRKERIEAIKALLTENSINFEIR